MAQASARARLPRACSSFPLWQEERADRQHIHIGAQEAVEGLRGRVDDGLVLVERGIDQDGHAGELAEAVDQLPVERVDVAARRSAGGRCRPRA